MTATKRTDTRKPLFFMGTTYFLGAFNDNFYKQAALLLAVSMGRQELQGTGTALFALPFILCAAWAGWLADRFCKKHVVVFSKSLELCATLTGALGILLVDWTLVLSMIFLMGLQSTIFGPSLNGSVPELFEDRDVPRANAVLKLYTTLAILLGMALGGAALDQQWLDISRWFGPEVPFGRLLVGCGAVAASCAGLLASLGMRRLPAAGTAEPFPWAGPLKSLRETRMAGRDPLLALAFAGNGFFYGMASLAVLVINSLGVVELGLSKTLTGLLSVAMMLGICAGSFVAARISSVRRWAHIPAPACLCMGLALGAAAAAPVVPEGVRYIALFGVLALAGLAGGIFLIPIASFIQVRPAPSDKGKVIAAASFVAFVAIFLAGQVFDLLLLALSPAGMMAGCGVVTVLAAAVFRHMAARASALERTEQAGQDPVEDAVEKSSQSASHVAAQDAAEDAARDEARDAAESAVEDAAEGAAEDAMGVEAEAAVKDAIGNPAQQARQRSAPADGTAVAAQKPHAAGNGFLRAGTGSGGVGGKDLEECGGAERGCDSGRGNETQKGNDAQNGNDGQKDKGTGKGNDAGKSGDAGETGTQEGSR